MVTLRLKQILKSKQITQSELARRLGVNPMTVSGWVSGKRYPSIEVLDSLATMLDVDITDFFSAPRVAQPEVTLQARVGNDTVDLTPAIINAIAAIIKN
ncbi:MAG: helix-turn-helix domain-containing protein [Odoribacter sp.]|nr:helix-turn-helix domain-containing protein [Odoribacter sp.]